MRGSAAVILLGSRWAGDGDGQEAQHGLLIAARVRQKGRASKVPAWHIKGEAIRLAHVHELEKVGVASESRQRGLDVGLYCLVLVRVSGQRGCNAMQRQPRGRG
jgi:hypothetical protein